MKITNTLNTKCNIFAERHSFQKIMVTRGSMQIFCQNKTVFSESWENGRKYVRQQELLLNSENIQCISQY